MGHYDSCYVDYNLTTSTKTKDSDTLVILGIYIDQIKTILAKKSINVDIRIYYIYIDNYPKLRCTITDDDNLKTLKSIDVENEKISELFLALNLELKKYIIEISKSEPKEEIIIDGQIYKLVK